MNILLIGSGGREHALAWKLAQSPTLDRLYAAPGNPGIATHAMLSDVDITNQAAVIAFCKETQIDLVVIGPEGPLVDGLTDSLTAANIACFGPSQKAAQLEGSKGFTKELCSAAGIPTAAYERYTALDEALIGLDDFTSPYVIKADGLAAGKGVIIAATRMEAEAALADMFSGSFGGAGASVVIEDFMDGEEVSFFALSDGKTVIPFTSAQDHKRVGEGDTGPNTGGMGAYSPASVFTETLAHQTMREIIEPTVTLMAERGMPYCGVLFAGLMLTAQGPKLIEYNARFGDPETQVMMMRFEGDLAKTLYAVATGTLDKLPPLSFSDDIAVTIVMAANGYPGTPQKGCAIHVPDTDEESQVVFHAGTALREGQLVANGGRVLNVTARGGDIRTAVDRAYMALDEIDFADGFCRRDIGWRELARVEEA